MKRMKLYMWSSINDVKDVGVYDSVTKIIERCGGLNSIKIYASCRDNSYAVLTVHVYYHN